MGQWDTETRGAASLSHWAAADLEEEEHKKRHIEVLDEPRRIHDYVTYAQFVAERVAADPVFASPRPPIAVLFADIAALAAATVTALSKTGQPARRRRDRGWRLGSTTSS